MSLVVIASGEGPKGEWEELDTAAAVENVDQEAGLCLYRLTVPGDFPWRQYVLATIHLRDVPGQTKPPTKMFPAATHEIMVLALDPDQPPEPPWRFVFPANVMCQFVCTDDDVVRAVTRQAVEGVVNGVLPVEYPFQRYTAGGLPITVESVAGAFANRAMSEYWRDSIQYTIEHHVTGGHT